MLALLSSEWLGYILSAAGAIATVVAVWWSGRRSGAVGAENNGLRDTARGYEVRNEIDNRVARERDARDKLRADWTDQ
jgi:hypothetical protein